MIGANVNWFMLANGVLNMCAAGLAAWQADWRFAAIYSFWGMSSFLMSTR